MIAMLYADACNMRNRQEELGVCIQLKYSDLIKMTEEWWDRSQGWIAAMDGYKLFRKDRAGRQGGSVALYVGAAGMHGALLWCCGLTPVGSSAPHSCSLSTPLMVGWGGRSKGQKSENLCVDIKTV